MRTVSKESPEYSVHDPSMEIILFPESVVYSNSYLRTWFAHEETRIATSFDVGRHQLPLSTRIISVSNLDGGADS